MSRPVISRIWRQQHPCRVHVTKVAVLVFILAPLHAGSATLIVTSGGAAADEIFLRAIGGTGAGVVFIPTAASSLRSESGIIWNPDEQRNREKFEGELLKRFGLTRITILHTRDRHVANTEQFVLPLRQARAVWISGGNAGRLAAAYLGTRTEKELKAVLARGGVIAGESAGAIILGSYTVRGNPQKPVLMARGSEQGFGMLKDVAINPHLTSAKRETELVTVVDRYPRLLGLGIDDDTGLLVSDGVAEVFGRGRVAIYDNRKHNGMWYYWLNPGERFDVRARLPVK